MFLVLVSACGPKILPGSSGTSEDWSLHRNTYRYVRPQFEGTPTVLSLHLPYDTTAQKYDLAAMLKRLRDYRPTLFVFESKKLQIEGYRIQVYRGRSLKEASQARERSYNLFPNLTPYMFYSAPTYRVRVGDFLEPHEYQPFMKILKREFSQAIAVPDIINVFIEREDRLPYRPREIKNRR
ncbi:MAG: SPOR domain-containing protein [Microscillaceae bacterium]|nr:SPOR domain-containing protein [Microscillaceae bacterium]